MGTVSLFTLNTRFIATRLREQILTRLTRYLEVMKPFGKIFPLTVSSEDLVIPFFPFLLKEISFIGQCTSTPASVDKLLELASIHGVKPILEEYPLSVDGITDALKHLQAGEVRYRGVLKA